MNAPDLNSKFPLRGKGPRVYLSHSFQDQALATSMNRALTARGLQVVQDDAESLLSQHLPTALGARIEDSEVVLCLLTETANRSDWCRQEADLAIGKARDRRSFKFLPVVFSTANLYGPVSQWSYVDATRYSSAPDIDASLLDKVHEACLGVVELLPLSEDDAFCFSSERVRALIERGARQARAILDSDGVLPTAMEEAMAFFDSIEDVAVREAVLAQEERRHTDIKKHLDADDLLFPLYFRFVDRYLEGYSDRTSRGEKAIRNYVRLVLGVPLLRITSMYDLGEANSDLIGYQRSLERAAAAIAEHTSVEPSAGGYGEIAWALCGAGEKERFMRIGLDPQRGKKVGVTLYVPADTFNEDDRLILQIGESPEVMITQWTWLDYALPQIATQARNHAVREGWSLEDAESAVGWEISDYRKIGLP